MLPPDRERVRQILSETIGLLCKNGLSFDFELSVDALIGITIDHNDVFLVSIKDTYDSEKNLQKLTSSKSAVTAQIVNDSGQKDDCSKLDSAVTCNFPHSPATSNWSHSEDQSRFSKKTTPNNFISAQSSCKRTIERNEFLGDQTKRARASENANLSASRAKSMLLTDVKSEPCDVLLASKASGTVSCAKSPSYDTSRGQCSSGPSLLVNSELNNIKDAAQLRTRFPSYNEDSTGQVPDVSCLTKESNCHSPSDCLNQNANNDVNSELSADFSRCSSSFDKQITSQVTSKCRAVSSNSKKQSSPLASSTGTGNNSLATRYSLQTPSICHSGNSNCEKQTNSGTSSDCLTLEDSLNKTKSQTGSYQRRSNHTVYVESASSDSEVIYVKEEIPYIPFKSCSLNPDPSMLQNKDRGLTGAGLTLSSGKSLTLESLSCDHSMNWKGVPNNFIHHARRQQKDDWNTWIQDDVIPPAFEDTRSQEKQLTQAAQAILLYDGQYVPLRDIQRLRLCGMAAGQIRMAMEQLSSYDGKLGCFQVLHGGVNLFYKCPPNLIDREILESNYCIPWEKYRFHHNVTPASNITTKHNEQYWLKVASSSPYNSSNQALQTA